MEWGTTGWVSGAMRFYTISRCDLLVTLNPWKNHMHRCEYAKGEQEELMLVIVFLLDSKSVIPTPICNSNTSWTSKMLTLQLGCRWTLFWHWYHSIAENAATVGPTEVAVILMPAEWNVTTLILWICALRSVQAKRKGSLPAASVRGNLQPGLLQSLFPCPRVVKEISPCSRDSILRPWRIGRAPLPLPLQLGRNACQRSSRADNSLSNIWNQMRLTTAAIIYYYTASVRGRPLRCGSR